MGSVHQLRPPPKRKPAEVGTGAGFEGSAGTDNMVTNRASENKRCAGCQIRFRPLAEHHRYCGTCYRGGMALQHLQAARWLLARSG
jgi:hypothetical protein